MHYTIENVKYSEEKPAVRLYMYILLNSAKCLTFQSGVNRVQCERQAKFDGRSGNSEASGPTLRGVRCGRSILLQYTMGFGEEREWGRGGAGGGGDGKGKGFGSGSSKEGGIGRDKDGGKGDGSGGGVRFYYGRALQRMLCREQW